MSYVPIIVPTNVPPPSPRTRELAGLLAKVLDEYAKAHPAVTKGEIRAAVRMAQASAGPDKSMVAAGVSLVTGLLVAMSLAGVLYFRSAGDVEIRPMFPMIIVAVIVLLGLVLAIFKIQSR